MFKRLIDWWTRPSWEEYLAEFRAAVDALGREDDLQDTYNALVRKYNDLVAVYSDDRDALPFAPCRGKALEAEIARTALLNPDPKEADGPIAGWQDRLAFDFNVSETSPTVKGTMVTVDHVVARIVDGWSWADILRAHPELTAADVRTCVTYAASQDSLQAEDARAKGETE